jgi:hypothetical protein
MKMMKSVEARGGGKRRANMVKVVKMPVER